MNEQTKVEKYCWQLCYIVVKTWASLLCFFFSSNLNAFWGIFIVEQKKRVGNILTLNLCKLSKSIPIGLLKWKKKKWKQDFVQRKRLKLYTDQTQNCHVREITHHHIGKIKWQIFTTTHSSNDCVRMLDKPLFGKVICMISAENSEFFGCLFLKPASWIVCKCKRCLN